MRTRGDKDARRTRHVNRHLCRLGRSNRPWVSEPPVTRRNNFGLGSVAALDTFGARQATARAENVRGGLAVPGWFRSLASLFTGERTL